MNLLVKIYHTCFIIVMMLYHFIRYDVFGPKVLRCPPTNMSGKTVLITGSNTGIGKETARQIALMNPKKIILTSRDNAKGNQAILELRKLTGFEGFQLVQLDLNSLKSVEAAASKLLKEESKLDVLVLNAGTGATYGITEDGYDEMYQSNHLGHHLLTERLKPLLFAASKPDQLSRVVVLSSLAHVGGQSGTLKDVHVNGSGSDSQQYFNTKFLNMLFTIYLADKWANKVVVNAVHPGMIKSEFFSKLKDKTQEKKMGWLLKDEEYGASTVVYVATHPDTATSTGGYYHTMQRRNSSYHVTKELANTYMKQAESFLKL